MSYPIDAYPIGVSTHLGTVYAEKNSYELPPDEPVVVLRASDKGALAALKAFSAIAGEARPDLNAEIDAFRAFRQLPPREEGT